ncbi:MAG TPA: hypothetical protein VEI02_15490, partial [Planctomycetota bacterium]|nr:hypothetical protein [Planctomycetota bacterium]
PAPPPGAEPAYFLVAGPKASAVADATFARLGVRARDLEVSRGPAFKTGGAGGAARTRLVEAEGRPEVLAALLDALRAEGLTASTFGDRADAEKDGFTRAAASRPTAGRPPAKSAEASVQRVLLVVVER